MEDQCTAVHSSIKQPTNSQACQTAATPAVKREDSASASSSSTSIQIFRPIEFESSSSTTSTAATEGISSESGSDTAIDSAYSSDIHANGTSASTSPFCNKITASLQNKTLWKTFKRIGNEMIVTKPGRRLFPALLVSLHGLEPDVDYTIYLRVASADDQRYRYINMKWCATGESEVIQNEERQLFRHPSSPNSGHFWMKRPISFKSIKITHYAKSKHGNILLHTMHKYMMKIIVEQANGIKQTVPLPDTTFIAVSAYQNIELTQLKIDNNPFAKGFRYKIRASVGQQNMNSNSSNGASALPQQAALFSGDSPMLAYWHQLQVQGLLPQYSPILAMSTSSAFSSPSSTSSSSNTCSKEQSPTESTSNSEGDSPAVTSSHSVTNGITPHFPIFYPHPFISPQYQVPSKTEEDANNK